MVRPAENRLPSSAHPPRLRGLTSTTRFPNSWVDGAPRGGAVGTGSTRPSTPVARVDASSLVGAEGRQGILRDEMATPFGVAKLPPWS